jgi:endonuclease G
MNLPFDTIMNIHEQAVRIGLHTKRNQMLFGVNVEYVADLEQVNNLSGQLLSDLNAMNNVGVIVGGVVPLERWLRNAAYATSMQPDKQKVFRELADEVARTASSATSTSPTKNTQQERILFVSELLPFGFLAGAARTGKSVAKLTVRRFGSGQARNHPASNDPIQYYGTGWLIGPKHIITNHHVVSARDDGEAPADPSDFELQGRSLEVQFDYDQDNVAGEKFVSVGVSAANVQLDYAILELERETGRPPLPLWQRPIDFTEQSRLPVNIIQHPGGQPKQMAIRNNLAAALHGWDLAYYTDTNGGSSGSPVCNDRWQVLALHKASTMSMGKFNYQGKDTAWVNIGTTMDRIVADLRREQPELWTHIRAVVV